MLCGTMRDTPASEEALHRVSYLHQLLRLPLAAAQMPAAEPQNKGTAAMKSCIDNVALVCCAAADPAGDAVVALAVANGCCAVPPDCADAAVPDCADAADDADAGAACHCCPDESESVESPKDSRTQEG